MIPDYISPLVAYRTWQWDACGLRSLNNCLWNPGEALEAQCAAVATPEFPATHEPPDEACTCGIYGAKDYQHLVNIGYAKTDDQCGVHGEVYLWGKICDHDLGYRAQFAYPKNLTISFNDPPFTTKKVMARLETLAQYGVDLFLQQKTAKRQEAYDEIISSGKATPEEWDAYWSSVGAYWSSVGAYWASKPCNKNLIKVEHPIRALVWSQETGFNPHAFDEMVADRSKWCAYRGGPAVESQMLSPFAHELNGAGTGCAENCPACRWVNDMSEIEAD